MDNKFQVYLEMAAIAHPVIKHYAADFYLHDAKVLAGMKSGDVALWAPRESGSTLIIVARGGIANERASESFRAHNSAFNNLAWYEIATDIDGRWQVRTEDNPYEPIAQYVESTSAANRARIRDGLDPIIVNELHM